MLSKNLERGAGWRIAMWTAALVGAFVIAVIARSSGSEIQVQTSSAQPRTPVIFELFTSEGCSSCPPADTLLAQLADQQPVAGVEIIPLGMHVDYWDRLGWKDRFSSAALTERQQVYGATFRNESIYTPQAVVDGRQEFVGSDVRAARSALLKAASTGHGQAKLSIDPGASRIAVNLDVTGLPPIARGDRADLLVAITEDDLHTTVKGGENHGRVLSHVGVVRQLTKIGEVSDQGRATAHADLSFSPEWQRDRLKIVGFVQERRTRAILASAAVPVSQAGVGSHGDKSR